MCTYDLVGTNTQDVSFFVIPRALFTLCIFSVVELCSIRRGVKKVPLHGWKRTDFKRLLYISASSLLLGFDYIASSVDTDAVLSRYFSNGSSIEMSLIGFHLIMLLWHETGSKFLKFRLLTTR